MPIYATDETRLHANGSSTGTSLGLGFLLKALHFSGSMEFVSD